MTANGKLIDEITKKIKEYKDKSYDGDDLDDYDNGYRSGLSTALSIIKMITLTIPPTSPAVKGVDERLTLEDYLAIEDNVSRVYYEITNGRVSKRNTCASDVIAEYHEVLNGIVEEETEERLKDSQPKEMTNQPTDNEWIEKARKQFGEPTQWSKVNKKDFSKSILSNLPKPTEVVAPVDIDKIINDINKLYGIEEMIYQKEVKKIIKKHLKGTTPVEPTTKECKHENFITDGNFRHCNDCQVSWRSEPINQERLSELERKRESRGDKIINMTKYGESNIGEFLEDLQSLQSESEVVQK